MHRGEGGVKTDRHRDWNDAALSQGMLTPTRNWKKQRAGSPPETGGSATLLTPWSQHARICAKSLDHDPMDCSPPGSSVHGDSPGKNTGVSCHALLQGSSQHRNRTCVSYLLHWQVGSLPLSIPAAAAAKSLQSCPTLCDPIDSSPPGSAVPGILQARTLEWVAISFSIAWKWKVKVNSLSCDRLVATPWTAAYQAPPSMGFSRQEYWSGLPLPPEKPWFRHSGTDFRPLASRTVKEQILIKSPHLWYFVSAATGETKADVIFGLQRCVEINYTKNWRQWKTIFNLSL